jgi:hypothetical protein
LESIRKIILSEIKLTTKRGDYNWRYVQSKRPKSDEAFNKVHIYTFRTPKYKYIVDSEEYDNDFFLISFKPKLNKDFYVKQSQLSGKGGGYYDEYSYQTKEGIPLKVLGVLVDFIKSILSENPKASFGYFGAPDVKTGGDDDLFNTKRVRIYNELLVDSFSETHVVKKNVRFSGGLVMNKEMLVDNPDLLYFGQSILNKHL